MQDHTVVTPDTGDRTPAAERTPSLAPASPILELSEVSKTFGGVAALRHVDFDLRAGEVHALIGMNGAGKSTLVGVLSGAHTPDSGSIARHGELLPPLTPRRARELGISTVPQKRDLVESLTVTENLFLGELPRRAGLIDWAAAHREAADVLERIGLGTIPPRTPAGRLSMAEQTMVEIAREVHRGGEILILDEPTATLGGSAAADVRALIQRLRAQGRTIVFISHHLDEILELADRITVLRDGAHQMTVANEHLTIPDLVYAMAGDHVDEERPDRTSTPGAEMLAIDGLDVEGLLRDFGISVRAGEVVAVLGPAGDGQSALFPALSGLRRPNAGTISVQGTRLAAGSIAASLRSGLRCITGDRIAQGLIAGLTVDENITLARDRADGRLLVGWAALRARAASLRERFGVVTLQRNPPVGQLSGGNQQKVLLGKWPESDPAICFLEEPTNGVDVAAKAEIHRIVDRLVERGTAVLLATSDVQEVLRLADRIAVVHAGRLVAVRSITDVTRDELVALTVGDTTHD